MNKKLDASIYKNRATLALNRNESHLASRYLTRAAKTNPTDQEIYFTWGRTSSQQENFQQAQLKYKKAYLIDPKYELAIYNRGVIFEKLDKMEEAIKMFRQSLVTNPKHVSSHYNLGIRLTIMGQYDEALDCYQRVQELEPSDYSVYNNIGYLKLLQGKYEEAIGQFQETLKRTRTYFMAHISWVVSLFCKGNEEESRIVFEDAMKNLKDWCWNCDDRIRGVCDIYNVEKTRMERSLRVKGVSEEQKDVIEKNLKGIEFALELMNQEIASKDGRQC